MPQLSFRATDTMAQRIKDLSDAMEGQLPGLEVSQSDLLRMLIKQGLPVMELAYRRTVPGMSEQELGAWMAKTIQSLFDAADQLDIELPGFPRDE